MAYLAYYPFTNQNANDYGGSDLTGTVTSAPYVSSRIFGYTGAVRISTDVLSIFETGYQAASAANITYTLVFIPGEGSGYLMGQHDGATGIAIEQTQRGTVRIAVNATTSATVDIPPKEACVLTLTYTANSSILYVNGVASALGAFAGTPTIPTQPVAVGDGAVALDAVAVHIHDITADPAGVFYLAGVTDRYSPTLPLDSDPWTPAEYTGTDFTAWVDPSDSSVLTLDGSSNVLSIEDKSPARVGAMTLENTGVTIDPASINGVDTLIMNGRHLSIPSQPVGGSNVVDVIWLHHPQNETDIVGISGQTTANWVYCSQNGSTSTLVGASGTPTFRLNGIAQTWTNRGQSYAATNNNVGILGIEGFSTSAWGHFEIYGYSSQGSQYRYNAPSEMGEIFVFSDAPASVVREAFEGYLAHKYGITASLDAGHPYKSVQPTLADAIGNPVTFDLAGEIRTVKKTMVTLKKVDKHQSFMAGARPETDAYHMGHWNEVEMRDSNYRSPVAFHNLRDGSAGKNVVGGSDAAGPRVENAGLINGTVIDGESNPVSRLVRCVDRKTGQIVAERWSSRVDGTYEFRDLQLGTLYTIIGVDYTGQYNAVIADSVSPEPIV